MTLFIGLWIVFSPMGLLVYYQIKKELSESNRQLRDDIEKLKNDPASIEELARKEYGLIKKNEIIFQFRNKKKK